MKEEEFDKIKLIISENSSHFSLPLFSLVQTEQGERFLLTAKTGIADLFQTSQYVFRMSNYKKII